MSSPQVNRVKLTGKIVAGDKLSRAATTCRRNLFLTPAQIKPRHCTRRNCAPFQIAGVLMPRFRTLAAGLFVVALVGAFVRLGMWWVVEAVSSPEAIAVPGPHLQLVTDHLDLGQI